MRAPPLLPEETLYRVVRFARFNGISALVVAGVFGLMCAASKDLPGATIGVLVAGAGALELHGVGLLQYGEKRGVSWLIGSQLYLLVIVLAYIGYLSRHLDLDAVRLVMSAEQRDPNAAPRPGPRGRPRTNRTLANPNSGRLLSPPRSGSPLA